MNLTTALPQALGAYVCQQPLDWEEPVSSEEWQALLNAAAAHKILPMVYEAVRTCPAFPADEAAFAPWRQQIKQEVMVQTIRTGELTALLRQLEARGLSPVMAKGVVCRDLYPLPDARPSGDEDLYVPFDQLKPFHTALTECGMNCVATSPEQLDGCDFSYLKKPGYLYLELHGAPFPPDSRDCEGFNDLFAGWASRAIVRPVAGTPMRVMEHTDHLLYLLLHAFKHFIHGGVGLRQFCDIALYAQAWGTQIDWPRLQSACRAAHADCFAASILELGRRYFGLDNAHAAIPADWRVCEVPPDALLADVVRSGVYGHSTEERRFNGVFTRQAVVARQGNKAPSAFRSLWQAAFLPYRTMAGIYPYLTRFPFLLPVAWGQRLVNRAFHQHGLRAVRQTYACGQERIDLLREYRIL